MFLLSRFFLLSCLALSGLAQIVEEFAIEGPMTVHSVAVNTYLAERTKDPTNFNLSEDSPVMRRAKNYAVERLLVPAPSSLQLRARADDPSILQLPAPSEQGGFLAQAAVAAQESGSAALVSVEQSRALAIAVSEDISLGAISKAGALPAEASGWLKFAEEKLRKEHMMDHQSLLWQLGQHSLELEQTQSNFTFNATTAKEKFDSLRNWFEGGGGKFKLSQLAAKEDTCKNVEDDESGEVSKPKNTCSSAAKSKAGTGSSFRLLATEDLGAGDTILSIPLKLTMCRITARNVLIKNRGHYLGDQLKKTFEKNEVWGLAIFVLHEWFKEVNGDGSKWGPLLRSIHMRSLTTPVVQALKGTTTVEMSKKWLKDTDGFRWWSTEVDGPCSMTKGICVTKPKEKHAADGRFDMHVLRWGFMVVMQNAVRVRHAATGSTFLAIVPFINTLEKRVGTTSGISFDLDGSVSVRIDSDHKIGSDLGISVGDLNDAEHFLRFFNVPEESNHNNAVKMVLPGSLPADSKLSRCLKHEEAARKDECKDGSYRGDSMMWKSKVLTDWRKLMNLPPRLGDLRMWATKLHLYGDTPEEEKRLSAANQMIAGLPVSTDIMPAEEQVMLLGLARDNDEAALMVLGPAGDRPPPQLYAAPDPEEDPEAQRAMENLASLAAQLQMSLQLGSYFVNATLKVLNQTRDFFQHGVLPQAGLDELDQYLLKKIGMLAHCGVDKDMKIKQSNITKELMCAMRVHLMNESEMEVFCPAKVKVFEDNCQQVEFMNYTAISEDNELLVIKSFRDTISNLMMSYPTSMEEDRTLLREYESSSPGSSEIYGPIFINAVRLRLREKSMLQSTLDHLAEYEGSIRSGSVPFQLELKKLEREEADRRELERRAFYEEVQRKAAIRDPLAVLSVDMGKDSSGEPMKSNLTLFEGYDLKKTVQEFCVKYGVGQTDAVSLENALRARVINPPPLLLQMGVVVPTGERRVLSIAQGLNETFEVHVFCAKYNITEKEDCQNLVDKISKRIHPTGYQRTILLVVPVDAPDGRKLQIVVREGEQHDLLLFISDFLEFYKMSSDNALPLANEVNRRLASATLQIPVSLPMRRQVAIRFSANDNVTKVIEAFADFYDLDGSAKLQITKIAKAGMAPGTFIV